MAGNSNSGNSIAFRISENELEKKIKQFREEYGEGQHGMVSWPLFCSFLGYSEAVVRECYQRGKESKNAYSGRADLLEAFRTECKALTLATCSKQQQLAKEEINRDYFTSEADGPGDNSIRVLFGCAGDDRWIDAMK